MVSAWAQVGFKNNLSVSPIRMVLAYDLVFGSRRYI